jgi:methylenetetrahydrofolate dehydrogenase (NADP+)/methenyltetrahydrofolate cyclohydrolase
MTKILLAKPIIDEKLVVLKHEAGLQTKLGKKPYLRVFQVGKIAASDLYIAHKKRRCDEIGADFELVSLAENISSNALKDLINESNLDKKVTGCFVQFPLPSHINNLDVQQWIEPEKDLDCLNFQNLKNIYYNELPLSLDLSNLLLPCTPKGILSLFKYYQINLTGKKITVIGRSYIVTKPLVLLLNNLNATVFWCHSKSQNLREITQQSDIIISAIGQPNFIDESYFHQSREQIIVDVGMNKINDKTCGDCLTTTLPKNIIGYTPVPGGIGPLTVISLMENLIILNKKQIELKK